MAETQNQETSSVTPKKRVTRKNTTTKTSTTTAKKTTKKVRTFNKEDLIPCMSVTVGELIYSENYTKSKTRYEWFDYGDICEVEYQDLKAMLARKSDYLLYPYFIVQDDDFLEQNPRLKTISEQFYGLDDPINFFNKSVTQLKHDLNNAPDGIKDVVKSAASGLIKSGELDSIAIIKCIDECLGTEFTKMMF